MGTPFCFNGGNSRLHGGCRHNGARTLSLEDKSAGIHLQGEDHSVIIWFNFQLYGLIY